MPKGATAGGLSIFASEKFRTEIDNYFDRNHLPTYHLFADYFLSVDQQAKNMMLCAWDGLAWYIAYYNDDTQLGKHNDCSPVYTYTADRDTYDVEVSKYASERHDSWLWSLVLVNLGDDLKRCATNFRAVIANERVLATLNEE